MKFAILLSIIAGLVLSVQGQSGNIFIDAYESAVAMKELYDEETEYFREYLTWETDDMGYFTELTLEGVELATSAAHGAGIQECARTAHYWSRVNVEYLDYYIRQAEGAANDLHFTVIGLMRDMNIKDDLAHIDLFYYYHDYIMQEAYEDLWYWYSDNMFYAWLVVYIEWFYIYDELYYCLSDVLYG